MLIKGEEYACEVCMKGRRVSACQHSDRALYHINKMGRPASQSQHCQTLPKSGSASPSGLANRSVDNLPHTCTIDIPRKTTTSEVSHPPKKTHADPSNSSMIVKLKYKKRRANDVQRILDIRPHPTREFMRLENERLTSLKKSVFKDDDDESFVDDIPLLKTSVAKLKAAPAKNCPGDFIESRSSESASVLCDAPASVPIIPGLAKELGDGGDDGSTKMSAGWQSRASKSFSPNTSALRAEPSANISSPLLFPLLTDFEDGLPKTKVVQRPQRDQALAATAIGNQGLATPMRPSHLGRPVDLKAFGTDIFMRNTPLSDEELDVILPSEGYKIVGPPPGYAHLSAVAGKLMATSAPSRGFTMQEKSRTAMGKQLPTEISCSSCLRDRIRCVYDHVPDGCVRCRREGKNCSTSIPQGGSELGNFGANEHTVHRGTHQTLYHSDDPPPRAPSPTQDQTTSVSFPSLRSWQEMLEEKCREFQIHPPVFQIISDRRGGRTIWSSLVRVQGQNFSAQFWYDGQHVMNAKEDAAEVAFKIVTGSNPMSTAMIQSSNFHATQLSHESQSLKEGLQERSNLSRLHKPGPAKNSKTPISDSNEKATTSATASTTPAPYASPYAVPNSKFNSLVLIWNEARDASKMTASYICEVDGCQNPIFHNPSDVRPLCKIHSIQEKFQISSVKQARCAEKEKEDLLDTSTLISRDSGYVSRISSLTTEPGKHSPKEPTSTLETYWDLQSVVSLESRETDVTISSINPTALGGAAEEFVEVLVQKVEVHDLIVKGFQTMDVDRFERNFRRLLREFAINLRKEALNGVQKSVTKLVHSYRAHVTSIIREKFALDHSHTQAEAFHDIQKQKASKVMLERLLCNGAETSDPRADEAAAESDYGSGFSDNEEPILPNLEKVKDFMMLSAAFCELERRLREFVNPKPAFVELVEGLRNSHDASKASPEDSQKLLSIPVEQLSAVTFNGPNLSNLDVNMSDVCEARLTSPMNAPNSDHPMSVSINLKPQTKDEHHKIHKDAGDGGSITPSKRTWDPNDGISPPPKRQNTAKSSVETQHPVYSSTTEVPTNIFSTDEDIEMVDASYVPELMSPSYMGSVEDSYEVHEDHLMASQDKAEQEAGSRVLKDSSHVNSGLTREQRGFTPSQKLQTALSEQATPPEQGVATQTIGPRDSMGAEAEWEDGKAQDSLLVQVLRVTNDISPESIIAADAAINGPQNVKRARAENADLRTLAEDKVLPSTPGLVREGREESALEYRSVNRKTLSPNQQGGTVDEISAALYHQQTSRLSENMRANQGVFFKIKNMGRRLARPKALPNHERLEWKCGCGEDLFTDLPSASTEEISRLSAILHCTGLQPSHTGSHCAVNSFSNIRRPQLAQISSRTSSSSSTQSNGSSSSTLLGSVSSSSTSIIAHPFNQAYLEVCINTGEYTKTLSEIDLKDVGCDGELFKRIRSEYSRLRSFRSRFWLLKPSGVHFVKFAVQDPLRVGILQKPLSIPPQSEVDAKKYLYSPCPLQDDPPMPQDVFLHYLSCTAFDPKPAWLPRLPKKIDSSILRFTGAINEGWGIHIKEGPNWLAVGMINVCLMIMSGVAAGLWKYFMNDFQGAFGFAGWIVSVVNAVLVAYIAKWSQS